MREPGLGPTGQTAGSAEGDRGAGCDGGRRRVLLALLTAAVFSLGVGPCTRKPASGPARVIFVLFDVSGSTQGQRAQYLADFERVVTGAVNGMEKRRRASDRIVADRITENPLAQSNFPIREAFEPFDPSRTSDLRYRRELDQKKARIMSDARRIVMAPPDPNVRGTKILDALQLAERVFATYRASDNVLVLFSDMIEQSDRYDFSSQDLTEKGINQVIARERRDRRLPNLKGVRVYVSGALAAQAGGLPSERIFGIRDFWLRYFKEVGADLPQERYGPTLLEFEG